MRLFYVFLLSCLFLVSCGGSSEVDIEATNQSIEDAARKKMLEDSERVDSVVVLEEVSEAGLRDPVAQYRRYKTFINAAWADPELNLNDVQLRDLAADPFASLTLEDFDEAREEGYYFDDPAGYEDFETGDVRFLRSIVKKDDAGRVIFEEGDLVQFKACEVDDSIKKDSNSKSDRILNEDVYTFELLVEMKFEENRWKMNGSNSIQDIKGVSECTFLK